MEQRPVVLSLISNGTHEFPRYKIADQHLRFFDGEGWTTDEAKALLFDNSNSACRAMQDLLLLDHMEQRVRRFRAPVIIDLFCDEEVTKKQLTEWLVRVARLIIDSPRHGNGPLQNSLGLCNIDWGQLEEIKV